MFRAKTARLCSMLPFFLHPSFPANSVPSSLLLFRSLNRRKCFLWEEPGYPLFILAGVASGGRRLREQSFAQYRSWALPIGSHSVSESFCKGGMRMPPVGMCRLASWKTRQLALSLLLCDTAPPNLSNTQTHGPSLLFPPGRPSRLRTSDHKDDCLVWKAKAGREYGSVCSQCQSSPQPVPSTDLPATRMSCLRSGSSSPGELFSGGFLEQK